MPTGRPNPSFMTVVSPGVKREIADGWKSSGLKQPDYAAMHGISARTLRLWISRYSSIASVDPDRLAELVRSTIRSLEAALQAIEASGKLNDRKVPASERTVDARPPRSETCITRRPEPVRHCAPPDTFNWDLGPAG